MRLALNKEQWDKLCECTDVISSFPVTVGNFIAYFASKKEFSVFNIAHDSRRDLYGVWYENDLKKFEAKELIDAMFDLFCHLEGI